jgi:hypothetical protein
MTVKFAAKIGSRMNNKNLIIDFFYTYSGFII